MTRPAERPYFLEGIEYLEILDGDGHYLQLPKLTTAQRDALSATEGMMIYNTDTGRVAVYQDGSWVEIQPWVITGTTLNFFLSDDAADIGTYYYMYPTESGNGYSELTSPSLSTGDDQLLWSFVTEAGEPGIEVLALGAYTTTLFLKKTGNKDVRVYWKLFKRDTGGTETEILQSAVSDYLTADNSQYLISAYLNEDQVLDPSDRLVLKLYANVSGTGTDVTVTLTMEGDYDSRLTINVLSSAFNLDRLSDVTITSPADNELLAYDSGSGKWINQAPSEAGILAADGSVPLSGDLDANGHSIDGLLAVNDYFVWATEFSGTDLGAQINAAHAAHPEAVILIPPGTFSLETDVVGPMIIVGAGSNIAVGRLNYTTIITNGGRFKNCMLVGLRIEKGSSDTHPLWDNVTYTHLAHDIRSVGFSIGLEVKDQTFANLLTNVMISDTSTYALYLHGSVNGLTIDNLVITLNNTGQGVFINNSTAAMIRIKNSYIENCGGTGLAVLDAVESIYLEHVWFEDNDRNIRIMGDTGTPAYITLFEAKDCRFVGSSEHENYIDYVQVARFTNCYCSSDQKWTFAHPKKVLFDNFEFNGTILSGQEKVLPVTPREAGEVTGIPIDSTGVKTASVSFVRNFPTELDRVNVILKDPTATDFDAIVWVANMSNSGFDIKVKIVTASATPGATVRVLWTAYGF